MHDPETNDRYRQCKRQSGRATEWRDRLRSIPRVVVFASLVSISILVLATGCGFSNSAIPVKTSTLESPTSGADSEPAVEEVPDVLDVVDENGQSEQSSSNGGGEQRASRDEQAENESTSQRLADSDTGEDDEDSEYQNTLTIYQENLQQAEAARNAAQVALETADTSLSSAEADLDLATSAFREAEVDGDSDALDAAWASVSNAWDRWVNANEENELRLQEYREAEDRRERASIWLEQFKNNYEAQFDTFAVKGRISRCRTEYCSAAEFLYDKRFTVFQPHVLELVGVHYAHAKGLTGDGVRIAIEDDIVNYALPEFAGRVAFDGAELTYPIPFGDEYFSASKTCERASGYLRESLGCEVIRYSSEHDELETLTARWIVAKYGWPDEGKRWFIVNEYHEDGDWRRWSELPHATTTDDHGTSVASVAAGRDFGVAPGATIVPRATNFDPEAQQAEGQLTRSLLREISQLPVAERKVIDSTLADSIEEDYAQFDIINRSFGIGVFDPVSIEAVLSTETEWWGEGLRQILPQTWRAFMQTGTHPDERTIVVYAAGNETEEFGGLGADIPYYESHVRGHHLSVMALDHDASHADYTNFCGALPTDWDAERWGRHFCLAAPGTVNTAGSAGEGYIFHKRQGTSFAAPVVTGAIALLMEHFRGQLGNSAIVKRVVDTADHSGRYSHLEVYGAGLLDLKAALQPVGRTLTGTPATSADVLRTRVSVPPAIGDLGQRLSIQGVEVASLDSMGAPFWSSPEQYIYSLHDLVGVIPVFSEPEEVGGEHLHLGFTPGTIAGPANERGIRLLFGQDRIGLERASSDGFRWGLFGDSASWQGGSASGAFGNSAKSMTAWVGRDGRVEMAGGWALRGSATVALGRPFLESNRMLDVDPHVMSAWDLGLDRGERGQGAWWRLALSQPLRAESGNAEFTYLSGLADSAPVYN